MKFSQISIQGDPSHLREGGAIQPDEIRKEVLLRCAHDEMGLWKLTDALGRDAGLSILKDPMPDWIRAEAMAIIAEMLDLGLIEAGNPAAPIFDAEFKLIAQSVEDALNYIDCELDLLEGHWPSGGDICSFRATPAGERLANELTRTD